MSNNKQAIAPPSIDDIINADIAIPNIRQSELSRQNAVAEQQSISEKDLDREARTSEHQRSEAWKNHFAKAFIVAFWIFWAFFIAMSAVLIWHWLAPIQYQWLNDKQLDHLKTIIIAIFASNAITTQQRKLSR